MTDEQHRHQCETRQVLRWRVESKTAAMEYLEKVSKARGEAAAQRIKSDCATQWQRGNRGEKGDWR